MSTTTTFGPDREYQAFLAQKRFMIQRARATGAHFYYPRIAEPRSGALEWEWVEASGLGTVYSTTVVRSKSGNHNVALIDLAEGPRMMSRVVGLSPESVVIGMAATYGIGETPGFTSMELLAQASLAAINDASLTIADIDAVFSMLPDDPWCAMSVPEYLGIRPKLIESTRTGGSSFQIHALWAALALDAGLCDAVLVCYGSNQRSSSGGFAASGGTEFGYGRGFQPRNPPTSYWLSASRHMHEFGTTREQLAEVAVAARRWAQLNPDAFARDDLTIRDCLEARMVSDPLTVRDCCLVTDGAAAPGMTRADPPRVNR